MMKLRTALAALSGIALGLTVSTASFAQEVTLRLHQFLPAQATVPKQILDVWADNIEQDSEGRIKIDRFPAMQLGGSPPELYDQVVDGVADVVWTVVGYTPGRFPSTEVFELPFMVEDPMAASYAYWKMYEESMQEEFSDTKIVGTWVHGPGMIHSADPIESPADMAGMKVRGASRMVNELLGGLGATPVGMPVPAVPEALSKGVVDAVTIPWEVTAALKVAELVENHTEFEGNALYTVTFVLAMNKGVYDGLPDDLKAVVDKNSGLDFSVFAAEKMLVADGPARAIAEEAGNSIFTISAAEAEAEWLPIVAPVYDAWIAEMDAAGKDGQAMIDRARSLMAEYASN